VSTSIIRDRREPVVPSDLLILGPQVRIIDGNFATVLIVKVKIKARERVADDVLPGINSPLNIIGTRTNNLGRARVDKAESLEQMIVLGLLSEVLGVKRQALRLEVRSNVGTRESSAVNAVLTARSRLGITPLTTRSRLTARARKVSLATVGRIKIVVVPTSSTDVVAKTIGAVANEVLATNGVLSHVNMVNLAESPDASAVALTVVTIGTADIIILDSGIGDTIDRVGRVGQRAIKGTVV